MIAEGEVLQLMNSGDPALDEATYLGVIRRKTAKLFEAAAELGAMLGDADAATSSSRSPATGCTSAPRSSSSTTCSTIRATLAAIGKNLGDDLAEGKMTLPLIRAIAVGTPPTRRSSATRSAAAD